MEADLDTPCQLRLNLMMGRAGLTASKKMDGV